jgi:hypothetical protein
MSGKLERDDNTLSGVATVPIAVGKVIDLYIENPNGDTQVRTADRDDVMVQWLKHGTPGSPVFNDADIVDTQEDDNRISIKVTLATILGSADFGRSVLKFLEGGLKGGNPFGAFSGNRNSFDILVELPRPALMATPGKVRVRTANGDVDINDVIGSVDVATANGDVTTRGVRGETSLHAANGDLRLDQPIGRVTARTVSGDLALRGGELRRFTITTVSGDATVEAILTGDASRVETVSGDVTMDLTLPAATGGTLSARSISGDASVAPPFRSVAKRTWRIGPGTDDGPSIAFKSVSGDLTARGRLSTDVTRSAESGMLDASYAPEPPTPSMPPAPPTPPGFLHPPVLPTSPTRPIPSTFRGRSIDPPSSGESVEPSGSAAEPEDPRLAILRAVERGELDIDEAMQRLDAGK